MEKVSQKTKVWIVALLGPLFTTMAVLADSYGALNYVPSI
jgi:hypothetical protein